MDTDVVIKRAKKGGFASQVQIDGASGSGVRGKGKRKDDSWNIREPCPGGAVDPTVISILGCHVARAIWENPSTRGSIVMYSRPAKGAELRKMSLPGAVRSSILDYGLSHLLGCSFDHINANLISAFVKRWQPDTNTVHMPFGEITILLHDVQYLLGLPIEGEVYGPSKDAHGRPVKPLVDVCAMFGMDHKEILMPYRDDIPLYKNGGVLTEAVKYVVL